MEGKFVIMMSAVLVVVVVLGQTTHQVEAAPRTCCPSVGARNIYTLCRVAGGSRPFCASTAGCQRVNGNCPAGWTFDTLQTTAPASAAGGDDAVNKYCKSGCVSSVCTAITTLRDSDASEVVNGAVEKCIDACVDFCTKKGSVITTAAVETA